jgi:formyltetrahydrofolate deformylase
MKQHILLTECQDQPGLIAGITDICFKHRLNIIKNSEFVDPNSKVFFMRTVLEECGNFDKNIFLEDVDRVLPKGASRRIATKAKKRLVILATKEAHCLSDILMKNYIDAFDADILAIISNHKILEPLVNKFDIPFHYIGHENIDRAIHEQQVIDQIEFYKPDLVVLAKYMRILSKEFVSKFTNRIINIHHSFLPAFIGASPYKQAYARGVKMIGATAHFVNNELDQGPIIQQDVIHVNHSFQPEKLARAGQELEESVLLNALQLVIREKVFVHGNRTVVFN